MGEDGAWSRVRPLLTDITPAYKGVTLVAFGLIPQAWMCSLAPARCLRAETIGFSSRSATDTVTSAATQACELVSNQQGNNGDAGSGPGYAPRGFCRLDATAPQYERGISWLFGCVLYALPIGHTWHSRPGVTWLGDAALLMSPFSGVGGNVALAGAVDLADAFASSVGWEALAPNNLPQQSRASPRLNRLRRAARPIFEGPVET